MVTFVDAGNPLLILIICFGSAATAFYWSKWMGKLAAIVANRENIEKTVHASESFVHITLTALVVLVCICFPFISKTMIVPYLAGATAFGQSIDTLPLANSNMMVMVIMVAVLVLLFAFAILILLLPHAPFSERENRALTLFPTPSAATLATGEFSRELSDFYTDQFPLRTAWLSLMAELERLSGAREVGGILLGGDGYLIPRDEYDDLSIAHENASACRTFAERMAAALNDNYHSD
jgi:hypothetical protein